MSNGPREIRLKPAHDELKKLIDQLAQVDLATLDGLQVRRAGATRSAAAWLAVLQLAEQELEEWCPDGAQTFGIALKPR
ncbi:MAG: hypothetical protein ACRD09_16010 [Vicinamibacterales bacterium]